MEKNIDLFYFEKDTYCKLHKKSNLYDVLYPKNLLYFVSKNALTHKNKKKISEETIYTINALDGKYFDFLNQNKLKHSRRSQTKYINSFDDEYFNERFKENGLNEDYEVFCIPFFLVNEEINKESEIKLNNETTLAVLNYLEKIYGKDNVYFPGYVMTQRYCYDHTKKIVEAGEIYFKTGNMIRYIDWESQTYDKAIRIKSLTLPFCIKRTYESNKINLADLFRFATGIPYISLDENKLQEIGVHAEGFVGSELLEKIREEIDGEIIPVNTIINAKLLLSFNREITKKLAQKIAEE